MFDRGLFLSLRGIRRQLAAMPHDLYLVRLIHHVTRKAFPGERLWTATQMGQEATVRFLRIRNREGCDVYVQPYADDRNAGYVLLDLDHTDAATDTLERMRVNGHEPCVVLQTSPGHLQAWMQVSASCLEPALATAIARQLAHTYGGDLASADWRHLGRLAGFTNQKPLRRQGNGYAPWVRLLHAQVALATKGASLVQAAEQQIRCRTSNATGLLPGPGVRELVMPTSCTLSAAHDIYQSWLQRLRIPQRFPHPDWSIADKWIAKELLRRGTPVVEVGDLLRWGSPGFPRCHADPQNYLRRTVARALSELASTPFPAPPRGARCVPVEVETSCGPGHFSSRSELHGWSPVG